MSESSDHPPTSSPADKRSVDERPSDEMTSRGGGGWWRLPLLLVVVLAAIIAARSSEVRERGPATDGAASEDAAALPVAGADGKTVSLAIEFGDGRELKYDAIPWRPSMTVDDLMTAASRRSDGFTFVVGGELEKMMLFSIDRVKNESGRGKYWTYKLNNVLADRSMGARELEPGDRVLWTFGRQE